MFIISGNKVATTRSKRYGKIGDYFCLRNYEDKPSDIKFKIVSISREKLGDIASNLYWEEGFANPEEFKKFWLTIHRDWTPEKKFYLHIFQRICFQDWLEKKFDKKL